MLAGDDLREAVVVGAGLRVLGGGDLWVVVNNHDTGIVVEVELRQSVLLGLLCGLFGFIFATGRLILPGPLG